MISNNCTYRCDIIYREHPFECEPGGHTMIPSRSSGFICHKLVRTLQPLRGFPCNVRERNYLLCCRCLAQPMTPSTFTERNLCQRYRCLRRSSLWNGGHARHLGLLRGRRGARWFSRNGRGGG